MTLPLALSEMGGPEREQEEAARIRELFSDLPLWIDVKNEARVHLWYEAKFGYPIAPYGSSEHAISTFPTTAGTVAVRPGVAGISIFAPFGLEDLLSCTVRPNKTQITQAIYDGKGARWRSCWPKLNIEPWDCPDDNHGLSTKRHSNSTAAKPPPVWSTQRTVRAWGCEIGA